MIVVFRLCNSALPTFQYYFLQIKKTSVYLCQQTGEFECNGVQIVYIGLKADSPNVLKIR